MHYGREPLDWEKQTIWLDPYHHGEANVVYFNFTDTRNRFVVNRGDSKLITATTEEELDESTDIAGTYKFTTEED